MDKKTINLGGEEFEILVPLTLGQLTDLRIAVAAPPLDDYAENIRAETKKTRDILIAAIPELTHEKLLGMRIKPRDLGAAVNLILIESGLIVPKDAASGEAPAEASTGDA